MGRVQTRKSLSVSNELYMRLKEYTQKHPGTSMSGVVEEVIRIYLGLPERVITMGRKRPPEPADTPATTTTTRVTIDGPNHTIPRPPLVTPKKKVLEAREHVIRQRALERAGNIFTF